MSSWGKTITAFVPIADVAGIVVDVVSRLGILDDIAVVEGRFLRLLLQLVALEPEALQNIGVQPAVEHVDELIVVSQLLDLGSLLEHVLVGDVLDQLGFDQPAETFPIEKAGLWLQVLVDVGQLQRELLEDLLQHFGS